MTIVLSNSLRDTAAQLPNLWTNCRDLPRGAAAVLAALHLTRPDNRGMAVLPADEWPEALVFAHRGTISLELRRVAGAVLPQCIRDELDGCAERNAQRTRRLRELYGEIQLRLEARGIPFAALKGFTHSPLFGSAAEERPQCDIDLYVPLEQAFAARDVFLEWGYEPMEGLEDLPTDHLPAMIRKTGWEWHGDYFDVDIPFAVEIHVQFWNEKLERLRAPGTAGFWERRERRTAGGIEIPALAPPDALGYASLHFLKHVLQGTARPSHGFEIARFLHGLAASEHFWREWKATHHPRLRRLETAGFRLAQCWFGGDVADAVAEEVESLPEPARQWFHDFAASPLVNRFHPNKDELWLHVSLLDSHADAWRVAGRRLFPMRIPGPVSAGSVPASAMTIQKRVSKAAKRVAYGLARARHHAIALPRVVTSGAHWWFGSQFWIFMAAAALFNLALFIFVLLYNLLLLDLGYGEAFIGTLSSASTIGTLAGTLPAAWLARRFGLRRTLLGVLAGAAVVLGLRVGARTPAALAVLASAWGLIFAIWAVLLAPAIAASVTEKRRPAAFSLFFASMLSVGIAGNWIGGRLPQWVHGNQPALLLAAAMVLTAVGPAWYWRPKGAAAAPSGTARPWVLSPFLKRYLAAYAFWQLATGAFNPFHNVYFARLGYSAVRIGSLFSATQLLQVAALLLAPLVIRRAGLVGAITWMMAGTAFGLFGLAGGSGAVLAYAWYVCLQWMSEPGLNTLLMDKVSEPDRSSASSLNYLVAFGAQAVAAFTAGHLFAKFGYGPVLAGAGALALFAAAMFKELLAPGF